jgi:uncharacterized small protein (DUF1192 family)
MKFEAISKRLDALDTPGRCPHCEALEAMSEAELNELIAFLDGKIASLSRELNAKFPDGLPEPSPKCPSCQKAAAMSEEELDARLAELQDILQDAIGNESE